MQNIDLFKEKIVNIMGQNFDVLRLNDNTIKITTPFLSANNDNIIFYILLDDNILLTDDTFTFNNLNFLMDNVKKGKFLNKLLYEYGIEYKNKTFYVEVKPDVLERKLFEYLQFLIIINNLHLHIE